MKLTLITNSNIIEKIFSLVAYKLELELIITNHIDNIEQCDIIIVDETIDNIQSTNLLKLSKRVGILSNSLNSNFSFVVPKPFLPSQLIDIINKQSVQIEKDIEVDAIIEDDECIVSINTLDVNAGILNNQDIKEIKTILNKNKGIVDNNKDLYIDEISDIIDNVIDEINSKEER